MTGKKVAVILSGCGHRDGAEITEAVSALIALSETGAKVNIFAPDLKIRAIDHINGEPTGDERNVLREAARIARGKVAKLAQLSAEDFDALVIPGGVGAATNLSSWGVNGAKATVEAETERVIREFYDQQKPICAICIAPALVARVLGPNGITVTVGSESDASNEILKTGARHEICAVDDFVSDREHRVVTTPAYMYSDAKPHLLFKGIRAAVFETVEMA